MPEGKLFFNTDNRRITTFLVYLQNLNMCLYVFLALLSFSHKPKHNNINDTNLNAMEVNYVFIIMRTHSN